LRNTFKKGADYSIPKFCGSLRTFVLARYFMRSGIPIRRPIVCSV